jgi:predicted RNA-binding Zn-ribbon protein involved in translation (DUF1610 family)
MAKLMMCPMCGAEMNHHANKLTYVDSGAGLDEVIEELHYCPKCGDVESRRAEL